MRVRRWQYSDGCFTEEGKERYFGQNAEKEGYVKKNKDGSYSATEKGLDRTITEAVLYKNDQNNQLKTAAIAASVAVAEVMGSTLLSGGSFVLIPIGSAYLAGSNIKNAVKSSKLCKEYLQIGSTIVLQQTKNTNKKANNIINESFKRVNKQMKNTNH